MTRAEVDVLLPVHNAEAWIGQALDSLLQQDVDLRVLLLDDASTDSGPEQALSRGDSRVQVERLARSGIVGALNCGLALATAPFVARMDADDVSLPGRFPAQLALMRQDQHLSLVGCAFEAVDVHGRRLSVIAPPTDDADIRRRMHTQTPFAHGSFFFRRTAVEAAGPYDPAFAAAEDYDLIRRLGQVGRLGAVPEVLYQWRVHDGNTSSSVAAAEHDASSRVRDQVWLDQGVGAPRRGDMLTRLERARAAGPAGVAVSTQLVRTEILIAAQLRRRGRTRDAARTLVTVASLPPRYTGAVAQDLPARLREVRRHRRRSG